MQILLNEDYETCIEPYQCQDDLNILLAVQKLQRDHNDVYDFVKTIINPYRHYETKPVGYHLNEIGFQLFKTENPRFAYSNYKPYLEILESWITLLNMVNCEILDPAMFVVIDHWTLVEWSKLMLKSTLIFGINDFNALPFHSLLWPCSPHFEKVYIIKPHLSDCCSNQKYVVCVHMNIVFYHLDRSECPLNWSYWLNHQQNIFSKLQHSWQEQCISVCQPMLDVYEDLDLLTLKNLILNDPNAIDFFQNFITEKCLLL